MNVDTNGIVVLAIMMPALISVIAIFVCISRRTESILEILSNHSEPSERIEWKDDGF